MNGIILIDKPKDFTSFDVVAKMRKICNTKKIGHAGTLDPLATGVLPILVGNATKVQELLQNSDKEYLATFKLGITTDTEDITGKILSETAVHVDLNSLKNTLRKFEGKIQQIPPMYSAIKYNGKKLYELARNGISIDRKSRNITINSISLIDFNLKTNIVKILVSCSKGTYIRTLCSDIGASLGCGSTLTDLCRTKACSFTVSDCISITDAENFALNNTLSKNIIDTSNALLKYDKISVTEKQSIRFKNGGALDLDRLKINNIIDKSILRVFYNDTLIGLGTINLQKKQLDIFKILTV